MPVSEARPRPRTAGRAESANGPRRCSSSVRSRRCAAQVAQRRGLQPCRGAQLGERRAQLAQEAGQLVDGRLQRGGAAGRGLRRVAGLADEASDVAAVARDADERAVGVARQRVDRAPVGGEDLEHLVGLAQGGDGPAQRRVEVLAAAGEPDAELGEDEAEALARRAAQDVEDHVGRDRAGRLLDGDRVRGRAVLLARIAVEVVLADQRLRLDLAEDVGAKAREARLRHDDRRQRARGRALHGELLDLANRHPGRAQIRALGQAEGVVEHDGVALLVGGAGRRDRQPRARRRRGGRDREQEQQGARAREDPASDAHGPIGTWVSSQLKSGDGL